MWGELVEQAGSEPKGAEESTLALASNEFVVGTRELRCKVETTTRIGDLEEEAGVMIRPCLRCGLEPDREIGVGGHMSGDVFAQLPNDRGGGRAISGREPTGVESSLDIVEDAT